MPEPLGLIETFVMEMVESLVAAGTAAVPSPALLAGEGEGEGTSLFGGEGWDAEARLASWNPHLNPLPRVLRERTVFHFSMQSRWRMPNQPLEPTAGRCCALESRRSSRRRGSAPGR